MRGVYLSSGTEPTREYAPPLVGLGRYADWSEARVSAARVAPAETVILAGAASIAPRQRSRSAFATGTSGVCRRTGNEPESLRSTGGTARTGASLLVAELTVALRYSGVGLDHHGFDGLCCPARGPVEFFSGLGSGKDEVNETLGHSMCGL